jgi:hypothetical protein
MLFGPTLLNCSPMPAARRPPPPPPPHTYPGTSLGRPESRAKQNEEITGSKSQADGSGNMFAPASRTLLYVHFTHALNRHCSVLSRPQGASLPHPSKGQRRWLNTLSKQFKLPPSSLLEPTWTISDKAAQEKGMTTGSY